jgi:hypothetical protein
MRRASFLFAELPEFIAERPAVMLASLIVTPDFAMRAKERDHITGHVGRNLIAFLRN